MNHPRIAFVVTFPEANLIRHIPQAASERAASRLAVKYWLACGLIKTRPTIDHNEPSSFTGVSVTEATYPCNT